jgi:hypothetical protein
MKNLSLILNAVLAIAVIVLFVKVFSGNANSTTGKAIFSNDSIATGKLPIAYINVDSLLLNYQFAKESNESLINKQEALTYLNSTDWYVTKKIETGVEIPEEVTIKRAEARALI